MVLLVIIISAMASPGRAVGETYAMVSTPARVVESGSSGTTITVSVSNAMFSSVGIPYSFSWSVRDPSGSSRSATSNVLSNSSSWSFSVSYPSNFGAALTLPGIYRANVSETLPSVTANVVTGTFRVVITDSDIYQRTSPVKLQAGGYLPTDTVNITINRPGFLAVFTTSKTPDPSGLVTASWQTLPNTPVGNYSVSVSGSTTPPKAVPDSQRFMMYPTNVTTTNFRVSKTALERSETQEFKFNASYLGGQIFTQGACSIRLTEPDGVTTHVMTASYNSSLRDFIGSYDVALSGGIGAWNATIPVVCLTDQYGNGGPLFPSTIMFNVLPASLTVSLSPSNKALGVGDLFTIQATIITPGGANFILGTAQAIMTLSGQRVGTPVGLTYDPTRSQWIGTYKISASDPSGTWLVTVTAGDSYGNTGQSSVVEAVAIPTAGSASTLFWSYVVIVLLVALLGFIILITRKRGLTRREVKLDIQAIKQQADKVKNDDFLQSIHAQLQRKKQEVGLEKQDH